MLPSQLVFRNSMSWLNIEPIKFFLSIYLHAFTTWLKVSLQMYRRIVVWYAPNTNLGNWPLWHRGHIPFQELIRKPSQCLSTVNGVKISCLEIKRLWASMCVPSVIHTGKYGEPVVLFITCFFPLQTCSEVDCFSCSVFSFWEISFIHGLLQLWCCWLRNLCFPLLPLKSFTFHSAANSYQKCLQSYRQYQHQLFEGTWQLSSRFNQT